MFSFFNSLSKNKEIVRKCYLKVLEREPDEVGFNHFLQMMRGWMKPNGIDEKKLIEILKKSDEYKKIKLARINDRKPKYKFKGLYGIEYLIRPNSVLDNDVAKNGVYDKWLCSKLKGLIHKDAVIFDVGANAGLLSMPFAKVYVPNGYVYAFDPDIEVLNQMRKNIKLNNIKNIIIEELALQDNPKINQITLNKSRAVHDIGLRNDGLSTIEDDSIFRVGKEVIKASTIDKFVSEKKVDKLEFIKIDTEGSEYRVIKGGEKTIEKFYPIIFYEYQPFIGKSISFKNMEESFKLLNKFGYKQYLKIKEDKENLIEMKKYSKDYSPSDIICFHKSKLKSYSHFIIANK